ncbi:MAG: hypothetical protein VX988_08340 [Planctomycetota bacterium]|nr:hypothetical protein [Planctomycetota bacterium]MEE3220137.1 hypothetical protein [Planctomycetota bacterium]
MSEEPKPPRNRRFQFKLATIMLMTVLFSIFAALFGGFFRDDKGGDYKPKLLMLTLIAPVAVLIVFAYSHFLMSRRPPRRKKKW